jgi:putative adenylate-forming enzyme
MNLAETGCAIAAFVRTRWGLRFRDRAALERFQHARMTKFIDTGLPQAAFYSGCKGLDLRSLPIVDKALTLKHFAAFNVAGVSLDDAIAAATAAEQSLAPPPHFDARLTSGLSSGTQGPRGVFLASPGERATWAGILLARVLDRPLLRDLLLRRTPLRVAFFLRANSALYTTLRSRRIDFRFFDLSTGAHTHIDALVQFRPEVLVAPASVLAWLASEVLAGRTTLAPRRVISVAEVLEPDDTDRMGAAFRIPVHQLYQCTEGFLAYTCEHGVLHLNEEYVHIEPEWLDAAQTRFTPIVTDFTRRTQMIVRYRLNDILRVRETPCPCGRVTRALAAIDGRLDDVLWLPASGNRSQLMPLFPDAVRHAIAQTGGGIRDYRIEQHDEALHLAVDTVDADNPGDEEFAAISTAIDRLAIAQGMRPAVWQRVAMGSSTRSAKRRRIVCMQQPTPASPSLSTPSASPTLFTGVPHDA